MMTNAKDVAKVINLNGGELVGRTRLQKTFYFLERLGVGFGFDFQYHHYGPYSEELSIAAEDAIALELVKHEKRSGTKPHPYSVFLARYSPSVDEEDLSRINILNKLGQYDAITLELAATADFLETAGYGASAWSETAIRKSSKASSERIERAKRLLSDLHQQK